MKKRYIILTIILFLFSTTKTYASCTQEELNEFKKIEKSYYITTDFNSENKTYTMIIEEGNRSKFKYVFDINYQYECKEINSTRTECIGLKNGTSFYATIMGVTSECRESMRDDYIRLEKYNEYYNDPSCEGIEEFVLCQEIYDKEIDRETFDNRVELYKNSKKEKLEEENKTEENKVNETITYIKENLVQTIIITVFIILIIISIILAIISVIKSRRLE